LGVDGGKKASIVKLAEEIADGQHGNYDSLLTAQGGKLLFESYYMRGCDLSPNWGHFIG